MTKFDIVEQLKIKVKQDLNELKKAYEDVNESMGSEEKNSSGDKFETAREMAQQELSQIENRIKQAKQQAGILNTVRPDVMCDLGQIGALVETDSKYFYILSSLGKVQVGNKEVLTISAASPIGQNIMGKAVGDSIVFGNINEKIISIS
ncbi:MAG: 3-oxoacyl-ACP synthase [Flavobacteriales bacterium]|nr:3-oxoacyl-ACP synthase [Flavobacteriales bacterium]